MVLPLSTYKSGPFSINAVGSIEQKKIETKNISTFYRINGYIIDLFEHCPLHIKRANEK